MLGKVVLGTAMAGGLMLAGQAGVNADTVTVKSGDTLSAIASQSHTTIAQLAQANHISNVNQLTVGQKIEVGNASDGVAHQTYTVKNGDTLSSIASKFGTSVDAIKQLNGLSGDMIYVDQALKVNGQMAEVSVPAMQSASTSEVAQAQPQSSNVQSTQTVKPAAQESQVKAASQVTASSTAYTTSYGHTNQQAAQNVASSNSNVSSDNSSILDSADAQYISNHESGGNYNASNGAYRGRWQLSDSYLGGDYSPAHQDQVFLQYCNERYGGVHQAAEHERAFGWY